MRAARARIRAQAALTRDVDVCKSLSDKEWASGGTADAKDLKSFDRKVVRVRFPPGPVAPGVVVAGSDRRCGSQHPRNRSTGQQMDAARSMPRTDGAFVIYRRVQGSPEPPPVLLFLIMSYHF